MIKLRNKKTGEIGYGIKTVLDGEKLEIVSGNKIYLYNSIAELNEEWEDYEEPKEYWHIAELCGGLQKKQDTDNGEDRFNKQIGNYFETEAEAEKAVEKLKAWKRLKDKGIEPIDRTVEHFGLEILVRFIIDEPSDEKDLVLLFGGEE